MGCVRLDRRSGALALFAAVIQGVFVVVAGLVFKEFAHPQLIRLYTDVCGKLIYVIAFAGALFLSSLLAMFLTRRLTFLRFTMDAERGGNGRELSSVRLIVSGFAVVFGILCALVWIIAPEPGHYVRKGDGGSGKVFDAKDSGIPAQDNGPISIPFLTNTNSRR